MLQVLKQVNYSKYNNQLFDISFSTAPFDYKKTFYLSSSIQCDIYILRVKRYQV